MLEFAASNWNVSCWPSEWSIRQNEPKWSAVQSSSGFSKDYIISIAIRNW
jgi:hypothetical protein